MFLILFIHSVTIMLWLPMNSKYILWFEHNGVCPVSSESMSHHSMEDTALVSLTRYSFVGMEVVGEGEGEGEGGGLFTQ